MVNAARLRDTALQLAVVAERMRGAEGAGVSTPGAVVPAVGGAGTLGVSPRVELALVPHAATSIDENRAANVCTRAFRSSRHISGGK